MATRDDVPRVDADRLRTFLDGRWGWVREQSRENLRDPRFQPAHDLPTPEYRQRVLEQAHAIVGTQAPALLFPVRWGGLGEVGAGVTAFEMFGFGDLSLLVKVGVQWGLFGGAILHLGTEHHHERYLRPMLNLDLVGCFAMTETGHGSDVQSVRTTATYDPQRRQFVIETPDEGARKDYIGNAADHARMAVVFAQLRTLDEEHGVHAFLVPIRDEDGQPCPGVTIEDCGHKAGLNGVDNGRLAFDAVRVTREALLDRYGQVAEDGTYSSPIDDTTKRFFRMLGALVWGRVCISGASVSATKVAMSIAVRYGEARRQFKRPGDGEEIVILDYLQHQRRLLPPLATTYALHFAQAALVERLHRVFSEEASERERRELESLAAGMKATASWHATATIQTCREACGGAGYLSVNRLPQLRADTDVFTTFEGDNTVLLQLVARGLLTDFRDEFGSLDTLGMVRFVANQVVETLIERTGTRKLLQAFTDAVDRDGRDDSDLYDRRWHLHLFQWREKHVIEGVARRIRSGVNAGRDAFDVFNDAQDHVLLAARVHLQRVVLEAFVEAIRACEDRDVADLLEAVCDLHVLSELERDRAWFLEHGRLSASRSKAIISAVNDSCRRLRPHARTLVDGFGVPEEPLGAPIALGAELRRQREKA